MKNNDTTALAMRALRFADEARQADWNKTPRDKLATAIICVLTDHPDARLVRVGSKDHRHTYEVCLSLKKRIGKGDTALAAWMNAIAVEQPRNGSKPSKARAEKAAGQWIVTDGGRAIRAKRGQSREQTERVAKRINRLRSKRRRTTEATTKNKTELQKKSMTTEKATECPKGKTYGRDPRKRHSFIDAGRARLPEGDERGDWHVVQKCKHCGEGREYDCIYA